MASFDPNQVDGPGVYLPPVHIDRRVHDDTHLLIWQVCGSSAVVVGDRHVVLSARYGCWVPAGVWHELTVSADSVMLPIFFERTANTAVLAAGSVHPIDAELHLLLLAILQQQHSFAAEVDVEGKAVAMLLARNADGVMPRWPTSREAGEVASVLARDPGDTRTSTELAEIVHLSERTLQRRFRDETGLTLQQWRVRNRLVNALGMLRAGALVNVAAARVGYSDVSAFRRAFKQHFGVSPSAHASLGEPLVTGF